MRLYGTTLQKFSALPKPRRSMPGGAPCVKHRSLDRRRDDPHSRLTTFFEKALVPMLCVGTSPGTLRVPNVGSGQDDSSMASSPVRFPAKRERTEGPVGNGYDDSERVWTQSVRACVPTLEHGICLACRSPGESATDFPPHPGPLPPGERAVKFRFWRDFWTPWATFYPRPEEGQCLSLKSSPTPIGKRSSRQ